MRRQAGFFDVDDRLKRLSDLGDQLEAFEAAVEFGAFRSELNAALTYSDGTQGGRPPFDPVMMFKILVIQTANNLSDERTEFLINDRLSCKTTNGPSLSVRPRRDTGNPRSFSDIGGSEKMCMCAAGILGTRPVDALGVKQELEKALAQDGKPTT